MSNHARRALPFLILALSACEKTPEPDIQKPRQSERVMLFTPAGPVVFAFENIGGLAITEQDILLGDYDSVLATARNQNIPDNIDLTQPLTSPLPSGFTFSVATANFAQLWPGGIVPYERAGDLSNPDIVTEAIEEYHKRTPIRFVQRTDEAAFVRFERIDNPFAPGTSYSPLGRQGGQQPVGLSDGSQTRTAIHEIGHAIGLFHEQARNDRDESVDIFLECVPLHLQYNFRKLGDWFWEAGYDLETYDTSSVMHYDSCAMSIAGEACIEEDECRTILDKDGNETIPSTRLTRDDVNGIYNLYGHFPSGNNLDAESFGYALAAADFDNDGHDDVAIGARQDQLGSLGNGGSVYLLKGTDAGLTPWDILRMAPDLGFPTENALYGSALAVGRFNNDSFDDLAVGAPGYTVEGDAEPSGGVFLYYGANRENMDMTRGAFLDQKGADSAQNLADAFFGAALGVTDVNADGFDELVIGAPRRSAHNTAGPKAGFVYVLKGGNTGLSTGLNIAESGFNTTAQDGDNFGAALATGDFDQDGFGDIAVGAPLDKTVGQSAGAVFLFRGSAAGPQPWVRVSVADFGESPVSGDDFGGALAVGEFDDQPGSDLAVGAIRRDESGTQDAGVVYVFSGSPSGMAPLVRLSAPTPQAAAHFGFSLLAADIDGDGDEDLAVGSTDEALANVNQGVVHLFRHQSGTLSHFALLGMTQGLAQLDDDFGHSLAAGDFNEDGLTDLVTGAPFRALPGQVRGGAVFSFHGLGGNAPPTFAGAFHQLSKGTDGF